MSMIEKFNINFTKKDVDFLIKKITEFNWTKVSNQNDWSLGTKPSILKELCEVNKASMIIVSHNPKVISSFETKMNWRDLNQVQENPVSKND